MNRSSLVLPFFFGAGYSILAQTHTSTQTGTVVVVRVLCRGVGVDLENDYALTLKVGTTHTRKSVGR